MKKGANTKKLSHEEWLNLRRNGIGGSDAASVAGLNPWKSAAGVYFDKIGEMSDTDAGDYNERLRIGNDLEDYVARRFSEATGKKIRRNNYMLHHDKYPFILGDIDREIIGENAILECKTTNSYASKDWKTEPPLHYQIQCLHYLLVTGAERCYIAALIGNEKFVYFTIERDEETINDLLKIEVDFWENYVEKRECPPPDGSKAYEEFISKRFPQDNGDIVDLSTNAADALEKYMQLKDEAKKLDEKLKLAQQIVQTEMAENQIAKGRNYIASWKTQTRTSLDTKRLKTDHPEICDQYNKTSSNRVFRVSEIKED